MTRRVYVLDAAAIFSGFPLSSYGEHYTTPLVTGEVLDSRSREILELATQLGRIRIVEPENKWLNEAIRASRKAGTFQKLSKADLSVIALSMQLKSEGLDPVVLTDDYRVQYTLKTCGIRFSSIKTMGIDRG